MVPKASRAGLKCYISCWQREVLAMLEAWWLRSLGIAGAGVAKAWSVGGILWGHGKMHSLFQTLSPHTTHTRAYPYTRTALPAYNCELFRWHNAAFCPSQSARQGPGSSSEKYRSVDYILIVLLTFSTGHLRSSQYPLPGNNWELAGPLFLHASFSSGVAGLFTWQVASKRAKE